MERLRRKRGQTSAVASFVLRVRRSGLAGLSLAPAGVVVLLVWLSFWVWLSPAMSAGQSDEGRNQLHQALARTGFASAVIPVRLPERAPASVRQQATLPTPSTETNPSDWPVEVSDPFDDNSSGWDVGEVREEEGTLRRDIGNGVYRWDMDVGEPMLDWILPDFDPFTDLYAAVDVRLVQGTADEIQFGLVLRSPDLRDRYMLYASLTRGVMLRRVADFESDTAIDWTASDFMRPDDWNRLAVLTDGSTVTLYVNDQLVAEFTDDFVFEKQVGLMVWVSAAGRFSVEFDDLEIRRGPEAAATAPAPGTPTSVAMAAMDASCARSSALDLERWPLLMCDTFDDNGNAWNVDVSSDDFQTTSRAVDDGTYTWDIRAFQPMSLQTLAPIDAVQDFYAAIDARRVKGPQDNTEYGLQFRFQESGDRYMFVVSEAGEFALYRMDDREWTTLIKPTPTDTLTPGAWNRIAAQAVGPELVFFINDQAVAHFRNDTYREGRILPAIQIGTADEAIVEFDNFEVRSAPDDAALTPVPTLVPSPTPVPAEGLSATAVPPDTPAPLPAPTREIAIAECPAVSAFDATGWPVLTCDTFDDNTNLWDVAPVSDSLGTLQRTIEDGVFTWDVEVRKTLRNSSMPALQSLTDFHAAVDARLISGTGVQYGLAFRVSDSGDLFILLLSDDKGFQLWRSFDGSMDQLIDWTPTAAMRPNEWNRLAVRAVGPHLTFYVNDQPVAELLDQPVFGGPVLLMVQVESPGTAAVQFDNFEVRAAPEDAALTPLPTLVPTPTMTNTPRPTLPPPPPDATGGSPAPSPVDWPILMSDTFDDNTNEWYTEPTIDEVAAVETNVSNGVYVWDLEAYTPFTTQRLANLDPVADFYLAADFFAVEEKAGDIEYGFQFRVQSLGDQYRFKVTTSDLYGLVRILEGETTVLAVGDVPSGLLRPGQWNRLAVLALGPTIIVYVNGQEVGRVTDPFIPRGDVFLTAQVTTPGRSGVYVDNFEVRQAPADAVLAPTPLPVVTACPNSPSVAPSDWVIIACDTYDENSYGWREGSDFQEGLEKVRVINGSYSCAFKAEERVYSWDEPNLGAVSDFFVSVQARRNSLMDSTGYGLLFRMQDYNNFFGMMIDGQQRFRVVARIDGWFRTLIDPTYNPAIRPGEVNSIAVKGEKRHFTFYVNDVVVGEIDDIHFKEGKVGVIIEPDRGDQGNIEFDDLQVRVPPEQAEI